MNAEWKLIIEYAVYLVIVVMGILILSILKRKSGAPKYSELEKMLKDLKAGLDKFASLIEEEGCGKREFFKRASKLLYAANKAEAGATALAQKQRDSDVDAIADRLEIVREELALYKYGKRAEGDRSGVDRATDCMDGILVSMEGIVARERGRRALRAKKN